MTMELFKQCAPLATNPRLQDERVLFTHFPICTAVVSELARCQGLARVQTTVRRRSVHMYMCGPRMHSLCTHGCQGTGLGMRRRAACTQAF